MVESTRDRLNAFRERMEALESDFMPCEQDGTGERYVLLLALFPFPRHLALPDDTSTFLQVAGDWQQEPPS